jgi:hypothetical protein
MSYPLTAVSGYWIVKNKFDTEYLTWFNNTLKINCPYIFFGDSQTIEIAKRYRGSLPTYYIECNIIDFYTYRFKDKILTHPRHCPSSELNMIWNEKVFLIQKAAELNPFNSEFFAWIDAGICTYREQLPPSRVFPDITKLHMLPKNQFIFTSSESHIYEPNKLSSYYHYIAGTSYILHTSIINRVVNLYKEYLEKLMNIGNIYTDQVILTHIFNDNPELFCRIGHGYGDVVKVLY